MKNLELKQMENLTGGLERPKCTYEYAFGLAGASTLFGGAGIIVFAAGMLWCE